MAYHLDAQIIPFQYAASRKRGRPKASRPLRDTGTAELVMKRARKETLEALDLCQERGIINVEQHWCGIHLRWLYTLRFGAPGVRAVDPLHLGGMDNKLHDEEWISARGQEYHQAVSALSEHNCAARVMAVCIFNERPLFLQKSISYAKHASAHQEMQQLLAGLDILKDLWCQGKTNC